MEMKSSHDENRSKICLVCCQLATRTIPASLLFLIQTYLIEGFSLENPKWPNGICQTCRHTISGFGKGNFDSIQAPWYDLSSMASFRPKRNPTEPCNWLICKLAMDRCKFGAKSSKRKLGTNRYPKENSEAKATPAIVKMCGNCLTSIRPGVHYQCNATQRFENLMNLLPQSTLNRVAASVISEKLNDSQDRASVLSSGGWAFQVQKRKNSDSNGVGKCLDLEQISDNSCLDLSACDLQRQTSLFFAVTMVFTSGKRCTPIIKKCKINSMIKLPKTTFTRSFG